MNRRQKMIIYQVLPRLFGNQNDACKCNGTIEENGVGKLADFTPKVLREIKMLGCTHIWYTGIIDMPRKPIIPSTGLSGTICLS